MAVQDGIAVTYATPVSATFKELLGGLYAAFDAGQDPNWRIKMGVMLPASITNPGDAGFVIEDTATSTINILFANSMGVGGLMVDGAAQAAADDVMVGVDPGGAVMDITTMGWMVGPRFSGWTADTQAATQFTLSGRSIVVSGADWLLIRHKAGAAGYNGGCFAGRYSRLDAGLGDGFCVFGGMWSDWATTSSNDHCAIEARDGAWVNTSRMLPLNTSGLTGDYATDGAGTWRICPVAIAIPGANLGTFGQATIVGTCPALYSGPNGTIATQWKDGATVKAVCMDGGAWLCRSDGAVAE